MNIEEIKKIDFKHILTILFLTFALMFLGFQILDNFGKQYDYFTINKEECFKLTNKHICTKATYKSINSNHTLILNKFDVCKLKGCLI